MAISQNFPTIAPSLNLNFARTKILDSRITFSRASTGTYVDSDGLIKSAATGQARFDHAPATGESLGLLVEEARTNLALNSDIFSTQNITVAAVAYTLSFYGTGTVTLSGASTAGPLVGTGAYPNRVSLTFTPTAGTLTATVTGTVSNAQLEAGSFSTSYIPTTASTVTRAADFVTVEGSNFSSWYNTTEGSMSVDIAGGITGLGGAANYSFLGISSGALIASSSTGNGFKYGSGSPASCTRFFINASSSVQADSNSTINSDKIAFAYKQDDFAFVRGGTLATDTSGTVPSGMDRFTLRDFGSNRYKRIAYWPTRLSDAILQNITK